MKDQETKDRFIQLRAEGLSYNRIAEELNVAKQTLINWSKEMSLEISNLRAIELVEATQEKFPLLKKQRVELLGERIKAIKEALENRDLTDVPTDRLFDLLFKAQGIVKQEAGEIVFQENPTIAKGL